LLLTAGVPAPQIPPGLEAREARWRDYVAGKKVLLLLDDAAGHEQVRPLLPGTAGSLVLITSRRRLAALQDAAVITLDTLPPGEAAALLTQLAARAGLRAGHPAITEITRLCGYLPLAIGMLARQLHHHPAWTASQLAAELAAAKDRLALMHAENLSVAAAFGLSYADLTPDQQRLFCHLGLVPGPSIDVHAAAALGGTSLATARRCLDALYDQHLLAEPAHGRYQLHDLLREYARALAATGDRAESVAAEGRLLDYYLHTALAAGRQAPTWTAAQHRVPPGRPPAHAPDLSTHQQAVAWLEAERPNLHAAAGHAAAAGQTLHAVQIPAAIGDLLLIHGHWDQAAALHRTALAAAKRAGDKAGQAGALNHLGILQQMTGDFRAAASLAQAAELYCDAGDRPGQARVLTQLAFLRSQAGDYPAATATVQRALALACGSGDQLRRADALNCLGLVQHLTGDYPAAAASQRQALALNEGIGHRLGQAYALSDLGVVQREMGDYLAAAASHQQALELFRDLVIGSARRWPLAGSASCGRRLATIPRPPPAISTPSRCTATSATSLARPRHSTASAS
jgi:tetratricopeptide (TPR) repeat protein